MSQYYVKSMESLKEHIRSQQVKEITEKVVQGREKGEELEGKFHNLAEVVEVENTT